LHALSANDASTAKRVAITGAGIAGASAAYYLQERQQSRLALDVAVYDALLQSGNGSNPSDFMMELTAYSM
jgi:glycine/D-amino acid oxidase-like deaminating enzyme